MRPALLALRFLVELLLLAAAFAVGYSLTGGFWGVGAGIAAAVMVGVIWGVFLSPKATIPLRPTMRTAVELVVFLAVGAGLAAIGRLGLGAALVASDVVILALLRWTATKGTPPP